MRGLRLIENPTELFLGDNPEEFLNVLGGPASLLLPGTDPSRYRAFVTLLHGNEPSGPMALWRYLRSGQQPAVNILAIVASVPAALEPPSFSHRMLPRARDLNRCFHPPFEDSQGKLAKEIMDTLRDYPLEAIIDMHNTSGTSPSFAIVSHVDKSHDALASLWTERLIVMNLHLGTLTETVDNLAPAVAVEVGGRLDEESHALAYEGLCRYFNTDQVLAGTETDWDMQSLVDPIRLELQEHSTLTYADTPSEFFDVTLKTTIEHHNFGQVAPDTLLGWVSDDVKALFSATDKHGKCAVERLVRVEDGRLYPAAPMQLFMITNNPEIATTDCIFYTAKG
ncbi:MAG: succinylglutamate desuccinylase [bacterium]